MGSGMRSLASELSVVAERLAGQPRVYADANVPAGLVAFMRLRLRWDVLFVTEHQDLRRKPDTEHFRLATQMRRTLLTLDRDYLDDRRFPPAATAGILVVAAPDEHGLARVLSRLDRSIFRPRPHRGKGRPRAAAPPLPLEGRKLQVHPDWRPAPAD